MLTINKKSWHYKLWGAFSPISHPKNLCQYMRQCVGSFALGIGILGMALWVMLMGAYPIIYFFDPDSSYGIFFVGVVLDGFLIMATIRFYTDTGSIPRNTFNRPIGKLISEWFPEHEVAEKKPNIIWEYLKALHNKTCPMIEYTDE